MLPRLRVMVHQATRSFFRTRFVIPGHLGEQGLAEHEQRPPRIAVSACHVRARLTVRGATGIGLRGSPGYRPRHIIGIPHRWRIWHWLRSGALHAFHKAVEPATPEMNLLLATVQYSRRQRLLELKQPHKVVFDTGLGHEVQHLHRPVLTHTMSTTDALLEHRRVPRKIKIHHHAGTLQVEPYPTGVGRQEHAAGRIRLEPLYQSATPVPRYAPVKQHVAMPRSVERTGHQLVTTQPLAEDHHLHVRLGERLIEHSQQFRNLGAMVLLRIQEVGAVTDHAHALQGSHEDLLVAVGEKVLFLPASNNAGDRFRVFFMKLPLGCSERQQV